MLDALGSRFAGLFYPIMEGSGSNGRQGELILKTKRNNWALSRPTFINMLKGAACLQLGLRPGVSP
jgi:hypothetical protein